MISLILTPEQKQRKIVVDIQMRIAVQTLIVKLMEMTKNESNNR